MKKKATAFVTAVGPYGTGSCSWGGLLLIDGVKRAWKGSIASTTRDRAALRVAIQMVRRLPAGCVVEIVTDNPSFIEAVNEEFRRLTKVFPSLDVELFKDPNEDLWLKLVTLSRTRKLRARQPYWRCKLFERCRRMALAVAWNYLAGRSRATDGGRE